VWVMTSETPIPVQNFRCFGVNARTFRIVGLPPYLGNGWSKKLHFFSGRFAM